MNRLETKALIMVVKAGLPKEVRRSVKMEIYTDTEKDQIILIFESDNGSRKTMSDKYSENNLYSKIQKHLPEAVRIKGVLNFIKSEIDIKYFDKNNQLHTL